ncbi:MAG: capsule assembly Wzi family protein [Bdellovibrionota bacterium]
MGAKSAATLFAEALGMNINKHIHTTIIFLAIFFISSFSHADVSVDIPLEHPIYNNIDRLSNLGIFPDDIVSIRPITIDRLQEMIESIDTRKPVNRQIEKDLEAIRVHLERENKKNSLQFNFQQGGMYSNARETPLLETDATTNPLLNMKGQSRFKKQGYQAWFQPRAYFSWEDWAAFDFEPFIGMTQDLATDNPQKNIYLRRAQLKLGFRNLEFSVGRSSVQWAQGFSGGLLFGGSQHPMDMIQLRSSSPTRLPWILKYLGPTQFSIFISKLDENQAFPGSVVIGERLAIKPHPTLELGFTQSIQFMGQGAPNLSAVDILSEVIGKRLQDINSVNLSNRNFVIDGSIRIAPLRNTKIYSEFFWEDCCEFIFTRDISKLIGISYPGLWGNRASLGFEYVQTTEIYNRHIPYTSGFINRGTSLGNQVGPDAEGYFLKYHHSLPDDIELDLINAFEIRGRNELSQRSLDIRTVVPAFETSERRIRHNLKLQKNWSSKYWASLAGGFEHIWNDLYIQGADRNQFMVQLESGFSF